MNHTNSWRRGSASSRGSQQRLATLHATNTSLLCSAVHLPRATCTPHALPCSHTPTSTATWHDAGKRGHKTPCRAEPATATTTTTPPQQQQPSAARDRLPSPEAVASWDAATAEFVNHVEGLEPAMVQKLLERAFGWGPQAFWRGSKVQEVPAEGQVSSVLLYLQGLGIKGADLLKVVKTFPEVMGCSVEGQLAVSVARLQGEWKLTGDVLMRALVRQPQVLGYSYDCEGSCIGECNRCWARF